MGLMLGGGMAFQPNAGCTKNQMMGGVVEVASVGRQGEYEVSPVSPRHGQEPGPPGVNRAAAFTAACSSPPASQVDTRRESMAPPGPTRPKRHSRCKVLLVAGRTGVPISQRALLDALGRGVGRGATKLVAFARDAFARLALRLRSSFSGDLLAADGSASVAGAGVIKPGSREALVRARQACTKVSRPAKSGICTSWRLFSVNRISCARTSLDITRLTVSSRMPR
ncbi:MAG: hypothetical protein ACI83N_001920 [Hydrogenophaga sp.]|jgi:hypothetical protein